MLKRIARILDAGVDLLEVKAQLVMRSFERVGITLVGYLGACVLMLVGVGTLLAACIVALAPLVGPAWALVIVGAGTILLGGIVIMLCSSGGPIRRSYRDQLDRRSKQAESSFVEAIQGPAPPEPASQTPGDDESELHRLAGVLTKNPLAAAGAGFALVSLLGIKRTMRLISAGTMLVGLVDSIRPKGAANGQGGMPFGRDGAPNVPPGTPDDRVRAGNGQWRDTTERVRSS